MKALRGVFLLSSSLWAFLFQTICAKKVKNFRVSPEITTGWVFCRKQALYASEFLYEFDKQIFWEYFKDLNTKKNIKNAGKDSKQDQAAILEILPSSKKSSTEFFRLLTLNLDMDTYAPKLYASFLSQQQLINKKCSDVFIEYQKGLFACSLDELEGKDLVGINPGPFDYRYIMDGPKQSPILRIFTIAGNENFNGILDDLIEKEFNIVVQLLVNPSTCPFYQEEVHPVGYGLEFELKSSQYVVEEPQIEIPDISDTSDETGLLKSFNSIKAIKSFSKIKEISGFHLKALNLFKNPKTFDAILKVSTNLPFLAEKLKGHKEAKETRIQSKESRFFINGLQLQPGNFDPFKMIDFINLYAKISHDLERITSDKFALKNILKSRLSASSDTSTSARFNLQGPSVIFLNDLEKDLRYSDWPKTFDSKSNRIETYSKNILTVIFPFKFDDLESIGLIQNLVQLIKHNYPMRFGIIPIVPTTKDSFYDHWIKSLYHVKNTFGLRKLIKFLEAGAEAFNSEKSLDSLQSILTDFNVEFKETFDDLELLNTKILSKKFDLKDGEVFINGVSFPITSNLPEILIDQYKREIEKISQNPKLFQIPDFYSNILIGSKSARFLMNPYQKDYEFETISPIFAIKNYFNLVKSTNLLSAWIAAEYDEEKSFSFLLKSLKSLKSLSQLRIFVTNSMTTMPNRIVLASSAVLSESPNDFDSVLEFLENFYQNYFGGSDKDSEDSKTDSNRRVFDKILKYSANLNEPIMQEIIKENEIFFSIHSEIDYKNSIFFSINGNSFIIPLDDAESLENISDNLVDIAESEHKQYAERFLKIVKNDNSEKVASKILAFSIFERKFFNLIQEGLSNFVLTTMDSHNESNPIVIGDEDSSMFHIEAIFNPFNREGQKFSSIMSYISSSDSSMFSFNLYFMTDPSKNDPREARIYRFVTPETRNSPISIVPVNDDETLMAMTIDLPSAWMTVTTFANTDLDNIRPMKVPHLQVSFALNSLVIEGQALISGDNDQVATGKLIQIFNAQTGLFESETSVMANFGYYQVKASSPGFWKLRASSSIQERQETGKDTEYPIFSGGTVFLKSFGGVFNRLKMSLQGIEVMNSPPKPKQADINVFSLASGLFYERLLRIMMTSVMKKKAPEATVKFWLLETTMSAQGVLALEVLSKELGFQYELMSYNWPAWLNPQTKKHRTIWAYKILFLDVLFPQNLDRIIFIDADQVVRSDLMELVNLDLKGNVYAMTPFCKDKPEMAPFRFWEHNYWKNHLKGRPYHISALFVVDLLELRKKLVADIIRAQYHMLSQDPNSLANLDQDLPNNLQDHIPIYSLPQEWLWCDSWCSESTKSKAKTIDLCNNPKTFESKLDQAKRIIPEWTEYDAEIEDILEKGKRKYVKNFKNMKMEENHEPFQHWEL